MSTLAAWLSGALPRLFDACEVQDELAGRLAENGNRLDINGDKVKPESPAAPLPIKPLPPKKTSDTMRSLNSTIGHSLNCSLIGLKRVSL